KATCLRLGEGRRLVAIQDVTEAKRIEAMRRDFVADASHEMKTPIASIQAVAETLEMAVLDDPDAVPRFMSTLLLEIRRLSALVQDLLDLARLEGRPGSRPVDRPPCGRAAQRLGPGRERTRAWIPLRPDHAGPPGGAGRRVRPWRRGAGARQGTGPGQEEVRNGIRRIQGTLPLT